MKWAKLHTGERLVNLSKIISVYKQNLQSQYIINILYEYDVLQTFTYAGQYERDKDFEHLSKILGCE